MLTPLQFLLAVISFILIIFAYDAYKRKWINILHFFVFLVWLIFIILFSIDGSYLDNFWAYFWVARGADVLVYISIVFLAYLYFEIMHKLTKQQIFNSDMIKFQAINDFNDRMDWTEIYNKVNVLQSSSVLENDIIEINNNLNDVENDEWNPKNDLKNNKNLKYNKKDFIFLIRCYNEDAVLSDTIEWVINAWYKKILLVDDWSIDLTRDIIKEKKQKYPNILILDLHHVINRWWWAANKTGFFFLSKFGYRLDVKYVVTFDADWQMDVKDLNNFVPYLNDNDLVLWSRFIKWATFSNMPPIRRVILWWAKIVTLIFNWVWVTDPHNWYRVIKLSAISKIKLLSDWMSYASEILDNIKSKKLSFTEVPVNIKYTQYSIWKWQKNLNALKILIDIIYKKFFFR